MTYNCGSFLSETITEKITEWFNNFPNEYMKKLKDLIKIL